MVDAVIQHLRTAGQNRRCENTRDIKISDNRFPANAVIGFSGSRNTIPFTGVFPVLHIFFRHFLVFCFKHLQQGNVSAHHSRQIIGRIGPAQFFMKIHLSERNDTVFIHADKFLCNFLQMGRLLYLKKSVNRCGRFECPQADIFPAAASSIPVSIGGQRNGISVILVWFQLIFIKESLDFFQFCVLIQEFPDLFRIPDCFSDII